MEWNRPAPDLKDIDTLANGFELLMMRNHYPVTEEEGIALCAPPKLRDSKLVTTSLSLDEQQSLINRAFNISRAIQMRRFFGGYHHAFCNTRTCNAKTSTPDEQASNAKLPSCPFAKGAKDPQVEEALKSFRPPSEIMTPPETNHVSDEEERQEKEAEEEEHIPAQHPRVTSSMEGSLSKCPIRMLDDRSPEEVAKYFEEHKHEIPRSHEICVKRYQSNEESIQRLDAKYGDLVNMIKGLGSKHQSFMPPATEYTAEGKCPRSDPMRNVVAWTQTLEQDNDENKNAAKDQRKSHFDRPLRDIRVGESPTRPWGIHLPVPPTEPNSSLKHFSQGEDATQSNLTDKQTDVHPSSVHSADKQPEEFSRPTTRQQPHGTTAPPPIIINGPVIIGYPPDEAVAFLRQLGADNVQQTM